MSKLKVLLTRVRSESLSGHISEILNNPDYHCFETYALPPTWDITDLDTYPLDLGDYDVVINTSGITLNEPVLKHFTQSARNVFDVNVIGAMNLTSEYARQRTAVNLPGLIIHVGSTGARKVFTNCSAYCASKAALAHYIQCAGYELKPSKISVVGVHPGNIKDTHMTQMVQMDLKWNRGMSTETIDDIYKDAHNPEDVAGFIVSILAFNGPDITGENYYLGAGWKG